MYLEIIDDQDHQTCGMITPVSLKIANPRLTGLRQRKKRSNICHQSLEKERGKYCFSLKMKK